jgi:hypothetical protein
MMKFYLYSPPVLSISGVVFLRIFTRALRTLQKHCKAKQRMPDVFNLCSPNHDTESHTLVVVYVNLLTFLIEFDTVQSTVMQIFDNNLSVSDMVGIFWTTQLLVIIIFIISGSRPQYKEKNYPFTVISTRNTCYVAWNVVLSVGVPLAVASTLLAEIPQLLQCYIPQEIHILVSFALSLLTFLVCLIWFVSDFWSAKCVVVFESRVSYKW